MIWDYKYSDKKINSIINCFFVYNYDNDLLYENDQVNKKTKCKGKGETGCDQYFYKLMMIGDCNKWQLFNQPFFNFTFEEKKILSRIISCKKISKFVFRFETIGQLILPVTKVLRFTIFSSSSFSTLNKKIEIRNQTTLPTLEVELLFILLSSILLVNETYK